MCKTCGESNGGNLSVSVPRDPKAQNHRRFTVGDAVNLAVQYYRSGSDEVAKEVLMYSASFSEWEAEDFLSALCGIRDKAYEKGGRDAAHEQFLEEFPEIR